MNVQHVQTGASFGSGRGSRPLDPSLRRLIHGPIRPMSEPGFFARLFARR